jgi:raffinose/stachyose/melibiose transport system permease protein
LANLSDPVDAVQPARTGLFRLTERQRFELTSKLPVVLIFLPPALLIFTVFVMLPMGEAAWYSFYNWNGYGPPTQWVGFKNYEVVFRNKVFLTALGNNFWIMGISILIQIPLALWLANMLASRIAGALVFRLLFFLPYVLADVAAGLIWRFVYDGDFGLVSHVIQLFGFEPAYLLAEREHAMSAVLAVIVWKYFGFHMMLFIAGLQAIDKDVMEAADIDGATGWQKFFFVTLPMLGSTVRLSVFFDVVGSLQLFDLVIPLTGGGPSNATQTLVTYLYQFGVVRLQIGFGSAVGVVLFIISVTLAFTYRRVFMRHD